MRIEISSRTKTIKEIFTKKEESKNKEDLLADEITLLCMAIAHKIYTTFDSDIPRYKMVNGIPLMIRAFLSEESYKENEDETR